MDKRGQFTKAVHYRAAAAAIGAPMVDDPDPRDPRYRVWLAFALAGNQIEHAFGFEFDDVMSAAGI